MDITNMHIDDILKKVKRIHFIYITAAESNYNVKTTI